MLIVRVTVLKKSERFHNTCVNTRFYAVDEPIVNDDLQQRSHKKNKKWLAFSKRDSDALERALQVYIYSVQKNKKEK